MESWTLESRHLIRDALASLERSGIGIVLVRNDANVLVGVLTHGDVRRALLRGATLETPIDGLLTRTFVRVSPGETRANVLDRMRALRVDAIPIVDGEGRAQGVHLLHDIVGVPEVASWAVVMAGGKGTRLAPLTDHVPKPMLPVAGRPILERIVLHLVGCGVRRVFLSVNYLAHVVEEHFGDGHRFGCRIEYLREDQPLGTGGALGLLPEAPTAPLAVMNGDLVTQFDLASMLATHRSTGAAATVAARTYLHTVPFGCLEVENGRMTRMEEKPTLERTVNAGIYLVEPAVVARVRKNEETTMPALLDDCLKRGERVTAWPLVDEWIDVGQRAELSRARGEG